jgi:GTP-binding protein
VDISDYTEGEKGILERYHTVNAELGQFSKELLEKPQIVALNKIDLVIDPEPLDKLLATFRELGFPVYAVSAVTGQGIQELVWEMGRQVAQLRERATKTGVGTEVE